MCVYNCCLWHIVDSYLVHFIERPIYVVCIAMVSVLAMLVSTLVVYLISKFVAVKRD